MEELTKDASRPVLVVAGMHRSGTSLTASIVEAAGVHMGDEVLPADAWNKKGYFEDVEFQRFHKGVLKAAGMSQRGWTTRSPIPVGEEFGSQARELIARKAALGKVWGWKDPRTTLFLDFWGEVLPGARFIFPFRAPWEVMDSLYRRVDSGELVSPRAALDYWLHYNRLACEFAATHPQRCAVAAVDGVAREPAEFVKKVNERFGLSLSGKVEGKPDADLLHGDETPWRGVMLGQLAPEAREMYERLNGLAMMPGAPWPAMESGAIAEGFMREWKECREAQRATKQYEDNTKGMWAGLRRMFSKS